MPEELISAETPDGEMPAHPWRPAEGRGPGIMLDLAADVNAPSLHHFGLADSYIAPAEVARARQVLTGQPDVTVETYEGADHAFDNPDFRLHHPQASAVAWERTGAFLADRLPPR